MQQIWRGRTRPGSAARRRAGSAADHAERQHIERDERRRNLFGYVTREAAGAAICSASKASRQAWR